MALSSAKAARRAVHAVIKRDRRIIKSLKLPAEEELKRLKQVARYETASAITGGTVPMMHLLCLPVSARRNANDTCVVTRVR